MLVTSDCSDSAIASGHAFVKDWGAAWPLTGVGWGLQLTAALRAVCSKVLSASVATCVLFAGWRPFRWPTHCVPAKPICTAAKASCSYACGQADADHQEPGQPHVSIQRLQLSSSSRIWACVVQLSGPELCCSCAVAPALWPWLSGQWWVLCRRGCFWPSQLLPCCASRFAHSRLRAVQLPAWCHSWICTL